MSVERWLAARWVTGTGFAAAALFAITPLMATEEPLAILLIYLHLPVYMVHQVEEHAGDRFRTFVNAELFGGREALTMTDVIVVNLPVVWGVNLLALYLALSIAPGWGLMAPYAMLLNALLHIGGLVRFRRYNPGLVTAIVLFLPLSLFTIWDLARLPGVTAGQHLTGIAIAVGVHLAIAAWVWMHAGRPAGLTRSSSPGPRPR